MDGENLNKDEILKELLYTEKDSLQKLKEMVNKTKALVKIDQKSSNIVLNSEFDFSNPEKILLILIGKYFSNEIGLTDKGCLEIQEIEEISKIKKTTLSKPLGVLINSGYVGKNDEKHYFIQHYKIEKAINSLFSKYIEKNPDAKEIRLKYKQKKIKKGENNE